jgi:ATP-dependent DNA helicase RecG
MRNLIALRLLLDELNICPAHDLEDQDLDFKDWNRRSLPDAVGLVVEMAICMANGGGGTVVFGINDKTVGRGAAITGVPPEVDANWLKKAVYDSTDPNLHQSLKHSPFQREQADC